MFHAPSSTTVHFRAMVITEHYFKTLVKPAHQPVAKTATKPSPALLHKVVGMERAYQFAVQYLVIIAHHSLST